MKHPAEEVLALFAGGDLPLVERWRAAAHLRRCGECAATVDLYKTSIGQNRANVENMPADLNWDRLSAEMTANIHLGLEAGECIAPLVSRPARGHFAWRAAAATAGLSVLLAGAWYMNPHPQRITHELKAPRIEMRTTATGLELQENGNAMVLLHGRSGQSQQRAIISSSPGSLRARYVDDDTGQITINNVYAE